MFSAISKQNIFDIYQQGPCCLMLPMINLKYITVYTVVASIHTTLALFVNWEEVKTCLYLYQLLKHVAICTI